MTKKIEITIPENIPWVQICIGISLNIVLVIFDLKHQSSKTVLLGLIAPSILIISTVSSTVSQELMYHKSNRKIRKWLLVSPFYVFSSTCIFLLLPLNSVNISRTFSGCLNWTDNPHGLMAFLVYAVITLVVVIWIPLFWFAVAVPFMFKQWISEEAPHLMFLACTGVTIAWAFVVLAHAPSY